jgi:hypothetical protein
MKMQHISDKMPAHNLRFGATAAEARMNWLWEFEMLCAA